MGSLTRPSTDRSDILVRVHAVLRTHEHPNMTEERSEAMRAAAENEFRSALRDRGTDPERNKLLVHLDELVGPMAFVAEQSGERRTWPLPAFQVWISRS